MANFADRLPENASGRYYVDSSCIDCDQCRSVAPEFFSRHEESGLSIIHHQPASAEDISRIEDILATCATGSIGNDGVC
jgi:ferredoxin